MAKLILNEARTEQYLAEPSIKRNAKYELGEELLKELSCNSYSRRVEEDAIGHIAKILEILDPIEVDEVGNNEGLMDEDISSNDDRDQTNSSMITKPKIKIGDEFLKILHDNSFNVEMPRNGGTMKEQLPLGRNCHGTDYFEFLYWLASKFDNYWELHKNVKSELWEFYVNGQTKGTIDDLVNYNEPCDESNEKTCAYLFFKPYLDAQDGKDIYEIIDINYSPIPIPAHHDISNPDELCQIEEFTVVRYSVGSYEEYITVGPSKINTVEKTPGIMSYIYHELFNKKD
ncbi:hypothetical protein Tco_0629962 [Tanacetum coccineum]|uniref:Uncharacterized protein n=1 Tax=Tanacetum coccineum TaxID=301880 RepID=A0ABQ4WUS1_9ASTR